MMCLRDVQYRQTDPLSGIVPPHLLETLARIRRTMEIGYPSRSRQLLMCGRCSRTVVFSAVSTSRTEDPLETVCLLILDAGWRPNQRIGNVAEILDAAIEWTCPECGEVDWTQQLLKFSRDGT